MQIPSLAPAGIFGWLSAPRTRLEPLGHSPFPQQYAFKSVESQYPFSARKSRTVQNSTSHIAQRVPREYQMNKRDSKEFLAAGEQEIDYTKLFFFPVASASTCVASHLGVDQ
ncbi:hypothetical protein Taro_033840, partial [Colocasia esculenta]|nr:hypothetical protein [Colocasia esculenta]